MAKDGILTGPVSDHQTGGFKPTSDEVRAADAARAAAKEEEEAVVKEIMTRSEVVNLFGEKIGELLIDAGYSTVSSVITAKNEDLKAISGLGKASLEKIRELAPTLYAEAIETPPGSPSFPQTGEESMSARVRRIKESQQ